MAKVKKVDVLENVKGIDLLGIIGVGEAFGFEDVERPSSTTGGVLNGRAPESLRANIDRTVQAVNVINRAYTPGVRIVSGYRSPAYNSAVHGALKSQHLQGLAVDMEPLDDDVSKLNQTVLELIESGALTEGGIGLYRTFIHYDLRGSRARWGSLSDNVRNGDT
jgi:hypothetical protein